MVYHSPHQATRRPLPALRGLGTGLLSVVLGMAWLALPAMTAARAADSAGGGVIPAVAKTEDKQPGAPAMPSTLIELDGSISSSPDGSDLIYRWRQVSGPKVELSDYASAKPYFRTSQPGVYEFELVVTANELDSEPHLVRLEIERENLPPVAKVPAEVWGQVGKPLEIDASKSFDPEGENLTYRWRLLTPGLDIPPHALAKSVLTFDPRQDGVFELELIVSDGEKFSAPAITRINIKPRPLPPVAKVRINTLDVPSPSAPAPALAAMAPPAGPRPVARIEGPVVAVAGEMVMLDGRKSSAASESGLEYLWRQKSGPFINDFELVLGGSAERFKADRAGDYEFELVVVDGDVESDPAFHKVRIQQELDPPVAVVVAPSRAQPGALVKLDATQSYDMAGNKLTYRWRQTGGPAVKNYVIDEALGDAAPAFHPPGSGMYSFELIVSNGKQQSRPIEIDIEVGDARRAPDLHIRGLEVAHVGERVVWEGSSPDALSRNIAFFWKQTDGPASALGQIMGNRAEITPPTPGRYVFELTAMENGMVTATTRRTLEVFKGAGPLSPQSGVVPHAEVRSAVAQQPNSMLRPPEPTVAMPPPVNGGNASGARRRVPEVTPASPLPDLPPPPSASPHADKSGGRAQAQVMMNDR